MSFKHWGLADYIEAFKKVNLTLHAKKDISDPVIKAFQSYKQYIKGFQLKWSLSNLLLKLFFAINARINIYTLKQKRRYYIFYGFKSA